MISNDKTLALLTTVFVFFLVLSLLNFIVYVLSAKRRTLLERLSSLKIIQAEKDQDELARPFLDRTLGAFSKWLVKSIGDITPRNLFQKVDDKLEKAGRPKNIRSGDFLTADGILGLTLLISSMFFLQDTEISKMQALILSLALTALGVYLPWFALARISSKRQYDIRKNLPDIMDLLVISVEAGSSFDMALQKVVQKYKGTVSREFQKVLQEINLGKSRKDALKDMAERVNVMELSSLVHAVIQSEQLGVGLGNVLRMQSDLIREKRQQWIEEKAMKAPIKMLFPLVFFIFPAMFVVILGPAMLNIMKVLGKK